MKFKLNIKIVFAVFCIIALLCVLFYKGSNENSSETGVRYTKSSFAMSTIVSQNVYGEYAQEAAIAVEEMIYEFEETFSMHIAQSEISQINTEAGKSAVSVAPETLNLVKTAKELSLQSENAFALTLAPISLAWGFSSESPQILTQQELSELLPLVDDSAIIINEQNSTVMLENEGMAIDLGAIAKGAACNLAREIYEEYNIESAVLSIGGNVYIHGQNTNGELFNVGFRNPNGAETQAIASVQLSGKVFAVSGGYERNFEENGQVYHHILNPKTGMPSNSDIITVGIIHEDGAVADFYSTALFVGGKQKAIEYFESGGSGIFMDSEYNLYVSKSLENSFELLESGYNVYFV